MKKALLTIILLLTFNGLSAQRMAFEQLWLFVENYLYSDFDEETDLEDVHIQLEHYYNNPIEWNKATKEELEAILILSDEEIDELLFYAYMNKPVHAIEELMLVENIPTPLVLILRHVLYVDEKNVQSPLKEQFKSGSHLLKINAIIPAEGKPEFVNHTYAGIPASLSAKYRYSAGNIFDIGVAMQSDAGDSWRQGFDLYRFFAQVKNIGIIRNITVGSYKAGFGEGLVFGQMTYGSSANKLISAHLNSTGVRGYGGTQETPTLNGASITLGKGKLRGSLLYSYTPLDADTTHGSWSSFTVTGYHRTRTEIERQSTLGLHTGGANINYDAQRWRIGTTAYYGHFTLPAVKPRGVWNAHHFEGTDQFATALNYGIQLTRFAFWGESALSCNKTIGYATTNNIRLHLENQFVITLNHRYFSPDYHAFFANSYSSRSTIRSEHGASVAFQIPLKGNMSLTAFADIFQPLYPTTTTPSRPAYELMVEYNARFKGNVNLLAKVRYRQKGVFDNTQTTPQESFYHIASAQVRVIYSYNSLIFTTSAFVNHSRKWGAMIHQDVIYAPKRIPIKIASRVALFSAEDYYTRFFLYEQNIVEQSFAPALYGEGIRWYLSAQYKFKIGFTVAVRVAESVLLNSGNSTRTDFSIALTYRY